MASFAFFSLLKKKKKRTYQPLIVVWNPVTVQFRIIPKPDADSSIPFKDQDEKDDIIHSSRPLNVSSSFPCIGFGSVRHYNDDGIMIATEYKLVKSFCSDDHNKITVFRAQVFFQNTKSWEPVKNELELSSLAQSFPASLITVDGVMYWKVKLTGGECGVISFDMHREVFTVIKLPLVLQTQRHWAYHGLLSWKDSLAIAAYEYFTDSIHDHYIVTLWTMSDTKDSVWTSQFRLDSYLLPNGRFKIPLGAGWQDWFLISISRDDDAPSLSNALLCSYDPKTKMVEENVLCGGDIVSLYYGGVNYVPTLAPV